MTPRVSIQIELDPSFLFVILSLTPAPPQAVGARNIPTQTWACLSSQTPFINVTCGSYLNKPLKVLDRSSDIVGYRITEVPKSTQIPLKSLSKFIIVSGIIG